MCIDLNIRSGMSDHITYALGLSTDDITKQPMFNVLKLVPFGDFEQLLPWLTRRLEENNVIYFFSNILVFV